MRRRRLLAILLTLATMPAFAVRIQAQDTSAPSRREQKSILFLATDHFTRPYMRLIFEGFTDEVLKSSNPPGLYFETLDASRFEEDQYLENLRGWLREKYRERHIDMIVAIAEDALGFLARSRGEPWPAAQ